MCGSKNENAIIRRLRTPAKTILAELWTGKQLNITYRRHSQRLIALLGIYFFCYYSICHRNMRQSHFFSSIPSSHRPHDCHVFRSAAISWHNGARCWSRPYKCMCDTKTHNRLWWWWWCRTHQLGNVERGKMQGSNRKNNQQLLLSLVLVCAVFSQWLIITQHLVYYLLRKYIGSSNATELYLNAFERIHSRATKM